MQFEHLRVGPFFRPLSLEPVAISNPEFALLDELSFERDVIVEGDGDVA